MIIQCPECAKSFKIDQKLIPDDGRLVQCGSCKNKWFFKKNVDYKKTTSDYHKDDETNQNEIENLNEFSSKEKSKNNEADFKLLETETSVNESEQNIVEKNENVEPKKIKKKIGLLNVLLVFIITIIAVIILIDTFKSPLSNFFPNIEFLLYSLYELLKDINLFLMDLF